MPKQFRILVVRLSAIGDIVFASPLISALRARYPLALIDWLVQPESRSLLEHHPDLNEVIVWPRGEWQQLLKERRWYTLWCEIKRFRKELRSLDFDLAIDVQGLLKSGVLAWLSGARERVGLGSREFSQWLMTRVVDKSGDSKRIGSEYLKLAQELGLPIDNFKMQVELDKSDVAYAQYFIDERGLQAGYVIICPFTTRLQKHWIETYWVELIPHLEATFGMPVVMLGGPGDAEAAQHIESRLTSGLINQVAVTSLRQAAALIKYSELIIGVDTGLTHMGIAFIRPTICLFGSTCPYLDTTHDNAVVLYHKLDCSPCRRNPTCNGRFDCMRAITVDEVLEQAQRLLLEQSKAS